MPTDSASAAEPGDTPSVAGMAVDGSVLIVDDDQEMLALLTFVLERAGFTVVRASDAPSALARIKEATVDVAILDVNLGERDGFDLLREIREFSQVIVVMLTARDSEEDKVHALELGADDYVTKPFHNRELAARVRAHIRRQQGPMGPGGPGGLAPRGAPEVRHPDARAQDETPVQDGILVVGPITLNLARHSVTRDGELIQLTVTEFRLLQCLMERASTVVPTRTILEEVWGYADSEDADLVRITLYRLRRKLADDAANPQLLHTVSGVGTMLEPVPAREPVVARVAAPAMVPITVAAAGRTRR
jgi:DNA-binding response OmpR family regulator